MVWTPWSATREQVHREVDAADAAKVIHVKAEGFKRVAGSAEICGS